MRSTKRLGIILHFYSQIGRPLPALSGNNYEISMAPYTILRFLTYEALYMINRYLWMALVYQGDVVAHAMGRG